MANENDFNPKHVQFWDLSIHVFNIGWNGCNLIKELEERTGINRVTIRGKIYDAIKVEIIMCALKLKGTQVRVLCLGNNEIKVYGAKCLAEGLKDSNITSLSLYNSQIQSEGVKYLADILKVTRITCLGIQANDIGDEGMKYLAEGLRNTSIIKLNVGSNGIRIKGIQCLTDVLQDTNITYLSLSNDFPVDDPNQIGDEEVKYLVKHLKDSCITYLDLSCNNIGDAGARCLAQGLNDTQITQLEFDSSSTAHYIINQVTTKNKTIACKIQEAFKKLVVQNTQSDDLEFIIPNNTQNLDIGEYLYLIKTINDTPNLKAHIFYMIYEHTCHITHSNIIRKINEFVITLPDKFNSFINNKLPSLINLLGDYNYVDLVKQCEDMKCYDIVKNLLLHRELYYVDDNREILHPYIYKMLNKYGMPLYNELIDHKKRHDIISYYQNHLEIDGAQEIVDLLGSDAYQFHDGN